jgi:hypothetical protein
MVSKQGELKMNTETRAAKRAEAAQEEAVRMQEHLAERRSLMPGILFNLMVQVQKLDNAGMPVSVRMVTSLGRDQRAYMEADGVGLPGIVVTFESTGVQFNADDYGREVVLHVQSQDWEVESLERKLAEMQVEADAKAERRKLAEEAKKLLTPEQLAALREFN